jgi:hypothetical protein
MLVAGASEAAEWRNPRHCSGRVRGGVLKALYVVRVRARLATTTTATFVVFVIVVVVGASSSLIMCVVIVVVSIDLFGEAFVDTTVGPVNAADITPSMQTASKALRKQKPAVKAKAKAKAAVAVEDSDSDFEVVDADGNDDGDAEGEKHECRKRPSSTKASSAPKKPRTSTTDTDKGGDVGGKASSAPKKPRASTTDTDKGDDVGDGGEHSPVDAERWKLVRYGKEKRHAVAIVYAQAGGRRKQLCQLQVHGDSDLNYAAITPAFEFLKAGGDGECEARQVGYGFCLSALLLRLDLFSLRPPASPVFVIPSVHPRRRFLPSS